LFEIGFFGYPARPLSHSAPYFFAILLDTLTDKKIEAENRCWRLHFIGAAFAAFFSEK
jgi:hypothetical protein